MDQLPDLGTLVGTCTLPSNSPSCSGMLVHDHKDACLRLFLASTIRRTQ